MWIFTAIAVMCAAYVLLQASWLQLVVIVAFAIIGLFLAFRQGEREEEQRARIAEINRGQEEALRRQGDV